MMINDLDYMENAFYGISGGDRVSVYLGASASDQSAGISGSANASGDGYSSSSLFGGAYTTSDPHAWYRSSSYLYGYSSTPGARAYGDVHAFVFN